MSNKHKKKRNDKIFNHHTSTAKSNTSELLWKSRGIVPPPLQQIQRDSEISFPPLKLVQERN